MTIDLLHALNDVAIALQQSIQSGNGIYKIFQNQIGELGLRGGISLLDEDQKHLTFESVAFTTPLRVILKNFEKDLNLTSQGYQVPIDAIETYKQVIQEGETIFVEDTSSISAQIMPPQIKNVLHPLLVLLGAPPGIYTPLKFNNVVKGMLNIVGRQLSEEDIPAIRALANQFAVAMENSDLIKQLQTAKSELEIAYQATLEGWVQALDLRDHETEGHTVRTAKAATHLAHHMGIPKEKIPHIHRGALLHDIGKMAIPDNILRKPGPLAKTEWQIMRQHPEIAYQWLSKIKYLEQAIDIPYCHHERWDGSGYPRGLAEDDIPINARIFTVVDVWDAMTSDRPYRGPIPEEEVTRYIKNHTGILFDGQVVDHFFDLKSNDPTFFTNGHH